MPRLAAMRSSSDRAGPSSAKTVVQVRDELVDLDPLLFHRVTIAHGHRIVFHRLEVDGDAVRRTDLVLAAIAATDRLGLVVFAHEVRLHSLEDVTRGWR